MFCFFENSLKNYLQLKCTASIFDIFKEEIESIIEEDRPRIMASGQSYPPDHIYGTHGVNDGYEQNESYLTYFSGKNSVHLLDTLAHIHINLINNNN